jgi:hypothetical protein
MGRRRKGQWLVVNERQLAEIVEPDDSGNCMVQVVRPPGGACCASLTINH